MELPKLPLPKNAFVIYDPKTDKYSRGGNSPSWSTKPKVWSGIGPLKGHLSMFINLDYVGNAPNYSDRRKVYSLHRWQPYNEACIVIDIVTQKYVCTINQMYKEMILAREKQDAKDQWKRTTELIELIRKRNEMEYDREHGTAKDGNA